MSVPAHKSLLVRNVCLNDLAPGYLKGTIVRGHPVVWSLALRPDDAKQDPVVYGTKFGAVFLANAIGTQLRDPINPGLTRWHMAILNI